MASCFHELKFHFLLAHFLSHPLHYLHPMHCEWAPLETADLKALHESPIFSKRINRAICENNAMASLPISEEFLARLENSDRLQVCILFLAQSLKELRAVALYLAALVFHKHLISLVLKEERLRFREALGEEIFEVATREAPLLHGGLALLDHFEHFRADFDLERLSSKEISEKFYFLGVQILCRYLDSQEAFLSNLMERRWPPGVNLRGRTEILAPFGDKQQGALIKILKRRFPRWLAIIP